MAETAGLYLAPDDHDALEPLRACRRGLALNVLGADAASGAEEEDGEAGARRLEAIQHLICLGYLDEEDALPAGAAVEDRRRRAFDAAADDLAAHAGALCRGPALGDELAERAPGQAPGPLALAALEALTGFDDAAAAPADALSGGVTLWSRMVHWRLAALNLYHAPVEAPPGDESRIALGRLDALLNPRQDPGDRRISLRAVEVILAEHGAAMGDVERLLRRFVGTLGPDPLVFRGRQEDGHNRADFRSLVIGADGEFENRTTFGAFISDLFDDNATRPRFEGSPRDRADHAECAFGLALVQLSLWSFGYYEGLLDGAWGPASHHALETMARDRDVGPERFILNIAEGCHAVNPALFLTELYGATPRPAGAAATEADYVEAEIGDASLRPAADGAAADPPRQGFLAAFRAALGRGRRVVVAFGSIAKAIASSIKRGVQRVGRAIGGVLRSVGGLAAFLYKGVREAVRLLAEAARPFAHYVLRLPIVMSDVDGRPLVILDHALDRDATHWVSPRATTAVTDAFAALLARLTRASDIAVSLAIMAVEAMSPGVGWIRLGLKVAGLLRRLLALRFAPIPAQPG